MLSERLGVPETEEYFRDGVVFVDSEDLAPALLFYLRRPDLRRRVAAAGFDALAAAPQWRALVEPVGAIASARGCAGAPE